jgi:hypothetical protein
VFLETTDGAVELVWPADRTTWDPRARSVTFQNVDRTRVTAEEAVLVVVGGGGDSSAESGITSEAWLNQTTWIQRPSASCPLDARWYVGALAR